MMTTHSWAKKLIRLCLPAMLFGMLILSACENSLNDIKKIASNDEDKPYSHSTNVDVIYSDSAKVKAHMTAPLVIDFQDAAKPYKEFPKGIKIILYDEDLKEKGTVTSDYAIQRDKENIMEFRKNVVAQNSEGEVFKSEELIYDLGAKKFYSNKPVEITMTNGDIVHGSNFKSNESMYPWTIDNSQGVFNVTEKATQ